MGTPVSDVDIINDFIKVVNLKILFNHYEVCGSIIYAACNRYLHNILWDQIYSYSNSINEPCFVTRDFNTILHSSKRFGGAPMLTLTLWRILEILLWILVLLMMVVSLALNLVGTKKSYGKGLIKFNLNLYYSKIWGPNMEIFWSEFIKICIILFTMMIMFQRWIIFGKKRIKQKLNCWNHNIFKNIFTNNANMKNHLLNLRRLLDWSTWSFTCLIAPKIGLTGYKTWKKLIGGKKQIPKN